MASDRNNPWNTKTHPSPMLFLAQANFPLLQFTPWDADAKYDESSNISFHWRFMMWHLHWSPEFQSVDGQLLSLSPSDSGHLMVRGQHGWVLKDRLRQACETKPQAIFKTVSVRLKLFPLRQSCGVVWIEQVAGLLAFSACLSVRLACW